MLRVLCSMLRPRTPYSQVFGTVHRPREEKNKRKEKLEIRSELVDPGVLVQTRTLEKRSAPLADKYIWNTEYYTGYYYAYEKGARQRKPAKTGDASDRFSLEGFLFLSFSSCPFFRDFSETRGEGTARRGKADPISCKGTLALTSGEVFP